MTPRPRQIWRHSKTGREYTITEIGAVEHTVSTPNVVRTVCYFPNYEAGKKFLESIDATCFQRTVEEFLEQVQRDDGTWVQRFVRVS